MTICVFSVNIHWDKCLTEVKTFICVKSALYLKHKAHSWINIQKCIAIYLWREEKKKQENRIQGLYFKLCTVCIVTTWTVTIVNVGFQWIHFALELNAALKPVNNCLRFNTLICWVAKVIIIKIKWARARLRHWNQAKFLTNLHNLLWFKWNKFQVKHELFHTFSHFHCVITFHGITSIHFCVHVFFVFGLQVIDMSENHEVLL